MPFLLLLLIPAAFGLNPVIARALVDQFEPGTLSVVRWSLAAALTAAIALARGQAETWTIPHGERLRFALLGALGLGFCSYAAYAGVRTTTATTVGLIYACTAALVTLVEIAQGRLRATRVLVGGVAMCLVGVALVLTRGTLDALGATAIGRGEMWAAAGTIVWAGYTLSINRRRPALTPLAQFTLLGVAGAIACLVPAGLEVAQRGLPALTPIVAAWIVALVLLPSVGAFMGYSASVERNGGVLTSAALSLNPLYIALLAIVLLGEDVRWYHGAAIVLVIGGLGLINLDRTRGQTPRAV